MFLHQILDFLHFFISVMLVDDQPMKVVRGVVKVQTKQQSRDKSFCCILENLEEILENPGKT